MEIFLGPFFQLLISAIDIYMFIVFIAVIASWLTAFNVINTSNRFVYLVLDFTYRITEPALRPIRKFMPNLGGIDISPIVLILLLIFLQGVIANLAARLMASAY